jgi:hypothetical protein
MRPGSEGQYGDYATVAAAAAAVSENSATGPSAAKATGAEPPGRAREAGVVRTCVSQESFTLLVPPPASRPKSLAV